jgi:hypothetical protein
LETPPSLENKDYEEVPKEEDEDAKNFQENMEMPQSSLRRSTRVKNPPKRYDDHVSFVALISSDGEPGCYQEVMDGTKIVKSKIVMKEEMVALERNKTWDLVELSEGRKFFG